MADVNVVLLQHWKAEHDKKIAVMEKEVADLKELAYSKRMQVPFKVLKAYNDKYDGNNYFIWNNYCAVNALGEDMLNADMVAIMEEGVEMMTFRNKALSTALDLYFMTKRCEDSESELRELYARIANPHINNPVIKQDVGLFNPVMGPPESEGPILEAF